MEANQGASVLIDRTADHGRLRSVLSDWEYTETEIHRVLNENEMSEPIQDSMNDQVYANAHKRPGPVCWSQSSL
jgi:hypothetical protein